MGARKSGRKRERRLSRSAYRERTLRRVAERLLGRAVLGVEHPGGKSRESCRLLLENGESIIATRRDNVARARLETRTLDALNRHGARVPKLLGTNHANVLLQQEIRGERLSLALRETDRERTRALLAAALDSLAGAQRAATREGLERHVATLGAEPRWLETLVDRPRVIGRHLGVEAPSLDTETIVARLAVDEPRFIKWDARPGNALVSADGVYWFDWEHAGRRNRLDDVAWLLGDEFVPDDPDGERTLIERYVPLFAEPMGEREGHDYLMTYGTFHVLVRLGLILRYMDGEWWDLEHCITHDKVGVTLECARVLCRRGARWSAASPLLEALAPWFERLEPRLATL